MALDKDLDTKINNLDSDITQLNDLLNNQLASGKDDLLGLGALLESLNNADGIAEGIEQRLDGVLDNLDMLLASFDKEQPCADTPVQDPTKEVSHVSTPNPRQVLCSC